MYLYERIIGIGTYCFTLYIIYRLIITKKEKNLGKILFLYTVLLTIMAFFFVPPSGADLYRLKIYMMDYASSSFKEIYTQAIYSYTPIAILYMFFIGKTAISGLLPAITTFIVFNNIFYIYKKTVLKYEIKPKQTAFVLLFLMSTGLFMSTISGIRTILAFSIIVRCIFEELIENKLFIKNIIWYIIAGLIHPTGIVLAILRYLFLVLEKQKKQLQKYVIVILLGLLLMLLYTYIEPYIREMIGKSLSYISQRGFSYIWEYIIGGIILILILEIQHFYKKYIKPEHYDAGTHNMYRFSCIMNMVIIIFSFEYSIFHRFILLNSIIILPVLLNISKYLYDNFNDKRYSNFYKIIFIGSCIILLLECTRGSLSSLKFFEIK